MDERGEKEVKKLLFGLIMAIVITKPVSVYAQVASNQDDMPVSIPVTEIEVDQETGEFQVDIVVNESANYAGMEFGMVCAPECEITKVEYDRQLSTTGPAENDLTWFGFFDGEDSFSESIIATVYGKCQTGTDSEMALKTVKKYTVGDNEYSEEDFTIDTKISLLSEISIEEEEIPLATLDKEQGINAWVIIISCICAVAIIVALIYIGIIRKKRP